jgi:hypothetical protein
MDPKGSQCIQRNTTLEVKTPGLIVLIVMPLTYIYKVATFQIGVVAVTTILKIVLILDMYSLFPFRRYSCFVSFCLFSCFR